MNVPSVFRRMCDLSKTSSMVRTQKCPFVSVIVENSYNFYVDFKGMLYFDDGSPTNFPNAIKDAKFLSQFFKNLKRSEKKEYPFVSVFWNENNFVRCAASPVVFSHLSSDGWLHFSIGQKRPFEPHSLEIDKEGRVWHPFNGDVKGVCSNELMTELIDSFRDETTDPFFIYKNAEYAIRKI